MNAVVDITFLQFQINSLKVTKTCQSEGHRKRFQPIIVCSSSNQQHKLRLLEIQKKISYFFSACRRRSNNIASRRKLNHDLDFQTTCIKIQIACIRTRFPLPMEKIEVEALGVLLLCQQGSNIDVDIELRFLGHLPHLPLLRVLLSSGMESKFSGNSTPKVQSFCYRFFRKFLMKFQRLCRCQLKFGQAASQM